MSGVEANRMAIVTKDGLVYFCLTMWNVLAEVLWKVKFEPGDLDQIRPRRD